VEDYLAYASTKEADKIEKNSTSPDPKAATAARGWRSYLPTSRRFFLFGLFYIPDRCGVVSSLAPRLDERACGMGLFCGAASPVLRHGHPVFSPGTACSASGVQHRHHACIFWVIAAPVFVPRGRAL